MRHAAGLLAFFLIALAKPADTFDLRRLYGAPEIERFQMRPDVTLTVAYGTNGEACEFEIEPQKQFLQLPVANEMLSKDLVDQLMNEIAPAGSRGKELMPLGSVVVSGSCNGAVTFGEYENVQIELTYGRCEKEIGVHAAIVTLKRPTCEKWYKKPIVTPKPR
jgi:hypothetical protein